MQDRLAPAPGLVTRDRLFSVIVLLIGLFLVLEAFSYSYGSSIFLRVLTIVLTLLAAGRLVLSFLRPSPPSEGAGAESVQPAALVFALVLGYIVLIGLIGFFLATFVFCMASQTIFGRKVSVVHGLISLGLAIFIFTLFFSILGVSLPESALDLDRYFLIF